ncbi:MAG TPA: hypothetical protein VD907_03080 [Verrucomicrobiae bacterium]|nr:hypothetical protein [Verrucomicrobiae bacterium]
MKNASTTQKNKAKATYEPTKVALGVAAVASMSLLLLAISLIIVS